MSLASAFEEAARLNASFARCRAVAGYLREITPGGRALAGTPPGHTGELAVLGAEAGVGKRPCQGSLEELRRLTPLTTSEELTSEEIVAEPLFGRRVDHSLGVPEVEGGVAIQAVTYEISA